MTRFHPWRLLRSMSHIELRFADSDDEMGHFDHETQCVTITARMTQAERRSTLTHELVHAERGPLPFGCDAEVEEALVDGIAARRLITLDALVDALLWSSDHHELAEELWVDVPTLLARLQGLTAAEQKQIEFEVYSREQSL